MSEDLELKARRKEVHGLIKQNLRDTFTFEFWPWSQFVSTILFLTVILIGDPWNDKIALAYLLTFIWIAFQIFASYRIYKKEGSLD